MRTLSSKWLIGTAIAVAVVVVVSVVIGVTRGRGAVELRAESEPEGVIQRYLLALKDRDYATARGYMSAELQKYCSEENMRRSGDWFARQSEEVRIALLDRDTLASGKTEVRVRITTLNVSPPFGMNESSHEERYLLLSDDGRWRLDEPGWPLGWCPDLEKRPTKPVPQPGQ